MDVRKLTTLFASPDERLVAVLGNTIAETFLSTGVLGNGFAVLSDKRVYFRGRCFARIGKHFSVRTEERVVDVQDITGTGFVFSNPIWLLVLSVIFFCGIIVGVKCLQSDMTVAIIFLTAAPVIGFILLMVYSSAKHTLFEISFAGGGIAFDVRWFSAEEAQFFQKNIKLIGDVLKSKNNLVSRNYTTADELDKLANLLSQGLITREEYEAQKRSLLGTNAVADRVPPEQALRQSPTFSAPQTAPKAPQVSAFCTQCGYALKPNSVFCGKCGARVSAD